MKNTGEPGEVAGNGPVGGFRQKVFNLVGWIAFGLLVPPILAMAGYPQTQGFITDGLGAWGSPIALVAYFYALLFLRVLFGSDQRYSPVLLGYSLSFIYFSGALDIGFMQWLYKLTHQVSFLSFNILNLGAGIATVFLANALSGWKKAGMAADIALLVVLPAIALVAAGIFLPPLLGLQP
ncbi:MAG: hypothetical protein ABIJ86_07255 [Spirochaetota bacterium]